VGVAESIFLQHPFFFSFLLLCFFGFPGFAVPAFSPPFLRFRTRALRQERKSLCKRRSREERKRRRLWEMPPRSVCLNVFTTSLGNDICLEKEREVDVEVREVEDKMEGVEVAAERERHDSVQGSPNGTSHSAFSSGGFFLSRRLSHMHLAWHSSGPDSTLTYHHADTIATASSYPESNITPPGTISASAINIDTTTFPLSMGNPDSKPAPKWGRDQNSSPGQKLAMPTTCSTCSGPPILGVSLSRCSRCKRAFYCSKACQKAAWKQHKYDCVPTGSLRGLFPSSTTHTPDISTPASPVADESATEPSPAMDTSSMGATQNQG
jgi:hypothetical protein